MRVGRSVVCVLALLALASVARAGGVEDGEAGLAALDSGDYDAAIRLFTRAILIGKLSANDSEFAYLKRGAAFEAKGDRDHAVADFRKAVQIKPDDADAQTALQAALSGQSSGGSRPSGQAAAGSAMITGRPRRSVGADVGHGGPLLLGRPDRQTASRVVRPFHLADAPERSIVSTALQGRPVDGQ